MKRRRAFLLLVVAVPAALVIAALAALQSRDRPPSREKVATDLVLGGELIAYETWDGVPHVVFLDPGGTWIRLDHLKLDRVSIELPPAPAWQLSGDWYSLRRTDDPASAAFARDDGIEVLGQVNSSEIVALEVLLGRDWHRFDVAAPGFLVRIPDTGELPAQYRWLDRSGREVWSVEAEPPLRN
ncbi:MAG: hypothetical protein IT303_08310 [Dehalococcoidia bacterium]|nr:hypothetical protein [Dehalococcoidia bacterium]